MSRPDCAAIVCVDAVEFFGNEVETIKQIVGLLIFGTDAVEEPRDMEGGGTERGVS